MRVMVIMKASAESEAGQLPSTELLTAMGKYNEELVKAGIMLAVDGLHPSSRGKRVRFEAQGRRTVLDGPFTESKELVGGFWLWQVRSMEEAVEWVKRIPGHEPRGSMPGAEVEIRPVVEMDDFGVDFTREERDREQRLRDEIARKQES